MIDLQWREENVDDINAVITVMAIANIIGLLMVLDDAQKMYRTSLVIAWALAILVTELGYPLVGAGIAFAAVLGFMAAWRAKSQWAEGRTEDMQVDELLGKPLLREALGHLRENRLPQARDAIVAHLRDFPNDQDATDLLRACDERDGAGN